MIRVHLRPPSRTGSLFLIMLLGVVVLAMVSPGLCRSALRGLSPEEGRSFAIFVVSQGDLLLDLMGLGTYMAWKACGEVAADVVYDCYRLILDGGVVPSWFNKSTLVFIPKGDPGAGGVGVRLVLVIFVLYR